jgi:hypothetical protein
MCCLLSSHITAQQLFTPFSFASTQGNLRLSMSQGEPFVMNMQTTAFITTMGFHQGNPDGMSSLLNSESGNKLHIYPNPAHSYLVFEAEIPINKISIFDLQGARVMELTPRDATQYRMLLDLVPGIYFSSIYFTNGLTAHEKIIIQ